MPLTGDEINDRLLFHSGENENGLSVATQIGLLRVEFRRMMVEINILPDGRYKSLALTALEEALMWASKAV